MDGVPLLHPTVQKCSQNMLDTAAAILLWRRLSSCTVVRVPTKSNAP